MATPSHVPALLQGHPLPPKVNGDLIGALTIRLQACSVLDAFARIQFWGEQYSSDLYPYGSVEYPLIGSIPSLDNYLNDASPLRVSFLRDPNSQQQKFDLVGYAYIPKICITDMLEQVEYTAQDTQPKTIKLVLRRDVQIVTPDSGANGSNVCLGDAVFELLFRVMVPSNNTSQPSRHHSAGVAARQQQSMLPQQFLGQPVMRDMQCIPTNPNIHENIQRHQPMPSSLNPHQHKHLSNNGRECNESISYGSSVGQCSDFFGSSVEEKQSLLEELLDLCSDDMTIPTVDSNAPSCIDPYDMWISRMVANAASPPAKKFPSLVSAGSRQSNSLRKVGVLKLEINELAMLSSVTNSIKGKNDFYLQYTTSSFEFDHDRASLNDEMASASSSSIVEFVVCEQFSCGGSTRRITTPSKAAAGKSTNISLLTSIHTKHMKVAFKNDETVRQWLDGTMNFDLLCCASKSAGHSKLPRVAMLNRRKDDKPSTTSKNGKICIAQACLKLRDVLLSDTLTKHVKLDLVLVDGGGKFNNESVGKAGMKVGSMSVNIGLYPGDEANTDDDQSTSCSIQMRQPTTSQNVNDGNTQIIVNGLKPQISLSSSTPHPISVFLSNFAGAGRGIRSGAGEVVAKHTMSSESACGIKSNKQVHPLESKAEDNKSSMNKSTHEEKTSAAKLEPVKAPPMWLDIRVEQMSELKIDAASGKKTCLTLDMTCSEPILSLTDLNQSFNSSEMQGQQCMSRIIATDKPCNTVCSWQIALEAERRQERATIVTLQLLHGIGSPDIADRTLIGLAKIPFIIEPTGDSSQHKLCSLLPAIATNSWFDILDPKSSTQIGKIQVMVAVGMLRQIRGFSSICRSALIIQKWWKRLKSKETENSTPESQVSLNLSEIKPPVDSPFPSCESVVDPEFDTVHAGFISQHRKGRDFTTSNDDNQVSSPDSLYEEWSQQSQSLPRDESGYSSTHHDNTTTAKSKPLTNDDTQHDNQTSSELSRTSVHDEDVTLDSALIDEKASKVDEESPLVEVPGPNEHKSDDVDALGNTIQDNAVMSTLKPMNLEVSFSRGRDETVTHQKIGIDPPEEIKEETTKPHSSFNRDPNNKAPNSKRKIGGVSSDNNTNKEDQREYKRYRVKETGKQSNPYQTKMMTNPIQNENTASNNNAQYNYGEESETLCPSSETSCSEECNQDSDAEDALTYRSLTSVMGSLNDINSRLLSRTVDEPQQKLDASSVPPATKSDGNHDNIADRFDACKSTHAKHQVHKSSQGSKKPDSPPVCHQMEPPGETTPTNKRKASNSADDNIVKTCEKGSSPMSTTNLYADATTSPSGDSLLANTSSSIQQRKQDEDEHCVMGGESTDAIVDEKQVTSSNSNSKTNEPKVDEPGDYPDEECCNSIEDGEDVACLAQEKRPGSSSNRSPLKRYRSSLLLSSHLRGGSSLPSYQLSGGRRRIRNGSSVLSPVLSPILYSKLSPALGRRGLLSSSRSKISNSFNKGKVDVEAKENRPNGDKNYNNSTRKIMDKERLERIFKS